MRHRRIRLLMTERRPPAPSPNAIWIEDADSLDQRKIVVGSTTYRRATYVKNHSFADWWIPLSEWSARKL
jgi:hypothetical protein